MEEMNDKIHHPNHYQTRSYECWKVEEELVEGMQGIDAHIFCSMFEYIWRFSKKNGVEDLKKARENLDHLIEHLENNHE